MVCDSINERFFVHQYFERFFVVQLTIYQHIIKLVKKKLPQLFKTKDSEKQILLHVQIISKLLDFLYKKADYLQTIHFSILRNFNIFQLLITLKFFDIFLY